ncbi:hypothetical protein [uncultured Chloroflexus sp.]|uniref:hypothetical protein n=1 Tax=uncultured Chloroflexus sp. TaxID=214040 RepID=UPI00262CA182|nr:hypothetical protein [uncultured Chloroflexus sp.]
MTTFGGEPATTAQIVLFGDSRAAAWPVPAGFAIANCGIPGFTSTQARFRYRLDVSPLKSKLVIVQVGAMIEQRWLGLGTQKSASYKPQLPISARS